MYIVTHVHMIIKKFIHILGIGEESLSILDEDGKVKGLRGRLRYVLGIFLP